MKINKKVIKIISSLSIFIIILSLSTLAYYVNSNKFFEDSRKNDINSGFALQRTANEFIINGSGSGTMLDTVTGLTWDMNMNHTGKLNWSLSNTYAEPTWNKTIKSYSYPSGKVNYPAFSYCDDLVQGNYDDYRLPTRGELMTLKNEIGPARITCSNLNSFGFTNCVNDYYWTENEFKFNKLYAWFVDFRLGFVNAADKTFRFQVVCVRRD